MSLRGWGVPLRCGVWPPRCFPRLGPTKFPAHGVAPQESPRRTPQPQRAKGRVSPYVAGPAPLSVHTSWHIRNRGHAQKRPWSLPTLPIGDRRVSWRSRAAPIRNPCCGPFVVSAGTPVFQFHRHHYHQQSPPHPGWPSFLPAAPPPAQVEIRLPHNAFGNRRQAPPSELVHPYHNTLPWGLPEP